MLVLGLSGSLRRGSYNGQLLAAAAGELPPSVAFEEWTDLGLVPPFNEDIDSISTPPVVVELRQALLRADAVIIATPEYNHSIPGQLKNALDWASRPFPDSSLRGKVVAVVGASTSLFGAVWAQAEVRRVLDAIGADVLDEELPVPSAHGAFASDGSLRDEELRAGLADIVQQVLSVASRPRQVEQVA